MRKLLMLGYIALAITSNAINAQKKESGKLKLYGDVRFRTELDRDSKKADDSMRPDRDRFRFRLRLGFIYILDKNFEFGGRLRTGNPKNPQSSHVTIGNGFNGKMISVDKAYIKYVNRGFYIWGGKNQMNMWEPDEMLWDSDVNPEGIALGKKIKIGNSARLQLNSGYFILNNDYGITDNTLKQTFGMHSNAAFAQAKYCTKIGAHQLILAPGFLTTYTTKMLGVNYQILTNFIQFKMTNGFAIHFDYFNNLEDLSGKVDPDFEDQKTGFSFTGSYTFTKKFSAQATYAQIQKYAVIDMFAQDDWVRWDNKIKDHNGEITKIHTRSSNFGGFGIILKYKLAKNMDTQLKFWQAKALVKGHDLYGIENKALETGTRIRWDINIKF